ncbi:MAG: DUF362 domain-containing protein [Bryobacteraceae bacterium]
MISGRITRRKLLYGSCLLPPLGARALAAQSYRVGAGRSSDAYTATNRAIDASSEWSQLGIAGRRVIIKPNLVVPALPESGKVVDSQVTRAVADRALAAGAASVDIVESGPALDFDACGYGFFRTYHPKVRLVDLQNEPSELTPVPSGWAYGAIYTAPMVVDGNAVFISIGKLKTHTNSIASLSQKNLIGISSPPNYATGQPETRWAMHDRGLDQAILDLNHLRPTHFALVDGVWGMEGWGPLFGTPVRMDTVLAGRNAVAVDRVGLALMGIPQYAVRHLIYASLAGLGPPDLSSVQVAGDTLAPRAFQRPTAPANFDPPSVSPSVFRPAAGASAEISVRYWAPCFRDITIQRLFDGSPEVQHVRTVVASGYRQSGRESAIWNGRDDQGAIAPPGRYAVLVRAFELTRTVRHADAISWVVVGA